MEKVYVNINDCEYQSGHKWVCSCGWESRVFGNYMNLKRVQMNDAAAIHRKECPLYEARHTDALYEDEDAPREDK